MKLLSVQLTEQKSGTYEECYQDYARQEKIEFAWERISHEMKKSGMYVYGLNLKIEHQITSMHLPKKKKKKKKKIEKSRNTIF
jgi:hypothetical protein